MPPISRRTFMKGAALAGTAAVGAAVARRVHAGSHLAGGGITHSHAHGDNDVVGDLRLDDFDPHAYLTAFHWGDRVTDLGGGRSRREYDIEAIDKEIEIAPGVVFPAWTYNGQVPGPTIRAREGDEVVVHFTNKGSHPHTMHFHGFHAADMDGVPGSGPGVIPPGGKFTYRFDAEPHGVHLYHCHALPVKRHIHKGLYGFYIVDPKEGWGEPAREMAFMMNAFDTNFDDENEVYAVNTKAFAYARKPIEVKRGERLRLFVGNITEFDAVNSFHVHANFFHYRENGHMSNAARFTDLVSFVQGERGVMEIAYARPGRYMFHAHQSEFTELGWMGLFEVSE